MSLDTEQKLRDTKTMLKKVLDKLSKKKKAVVENLELASQRSDENAVSRYRAVLREHDWFASQLEKALREIII